MHWLWASNLPEPLPLPSKDAYFKALGFRGAQRPYDIRAFGLFLLLRVKPSQISNPNPVNIMELFWK